MTDPSDRYRTRSFDEPSAPPPGRPWPRPPVPIRASWLDRPPNGARIAVAGLVLLRQRPGTAHGVVFLTLEDETDTVNVIVWKSVYERFRRAVIAGRLLKVTGRLQCEGPITHVIAEEIEDISHMLDMLVALDDADQADGDAPSTGGMAAPARRAATQVWPGPLRAGDQPGSTYPDPRAPPPDWAD